MLRLAWHRDPLSGEGARRHGGRWSRMGVPALYLAQTHATAIAEYHQDVVIPGTLIAYDVDGARIANLTGGGAEVEAALTAEWLRIARLEGGEPPSWRIADALIADGCEGALIPSARDRGGTNLVLWRWSAEGTEGARVTLVDPHGELARR